MPIVHNESSRGKRTALYIAWGNMMQRCYNPQHPEWKNYGGRGITVCERWHKFKNFRDDVGTHPGKGWSLDRPDNDGNYGPENWRWATRQEQAKNMRGKKLSPPQVSEIRKRRLAGEKLRALGNEFGVSAQTVSYIARGEIWA